MKQIVQAMPINFFSKSVYRNSNDLFYLGFKFKGFGYHNFKPVLTTLGFLFILFSTNTLSAQFKCATDYYDSIAIAHDPTILTRRAELNKFTAQFLKQSYKATDTIVIPMVFHVLHEYGQEHITIEKIQVGIDQMNLDYNAGNTELSSIVSEFKNIIGDAQVSFRLAKKDPNGNCTTGVVYYNTPLTNDASNSLKSVIKNWDPSSYLNVWTVKSIESGAAAWSQYPGVSAYLDGIVSLYNYLNDHTLSHEAGHYFNLPHTWGNSNEPGLDSNCNTDDGVADTPNTIGTTQNCNLDQTTCGSLDNVQNFMDYSTCESMFTAGQTDRMQAALHSILSGRNNLWTAENRLKTGTNNGYVAPMCAPVADFTDNIAAYNPGDPLEFNDYSNISVPTSWNWSFEGGEPSSSTLQNPTVVYHTPGVYPVTLTVSNEAGESTLKRDSLVFVPDTLKGIVAPALVNMEEKGFPYYPSDIFKSWSFEDSGHGNWELFKNGNTAMRIKNDTNINGTVNSLITSNINLSKIDNPDYIYFDYAYAMENSGSDDELKVFISPNCGEKWIIRSIQSGKSLVTSENEFVTSEFIPKSSEWKQGRIDISNYKANNYLKIKFQVVSNGGNYLYIDNLLVGSPTGLVSQQFLNHSFRVFPNPASNEIKVEFNLFSDDDVKIQLTNILGVNKYELVTKGIAGSNSQTINLKHLNLAGGIYLITIQGENIQGSKRILIQN